MKTSRYASTTTKQPQREFDQAISQQEPVPEPDWFEGYVSTKGTGLPPQIASMMFDDEDVESHEQANALEPFSAPQTSPPDPIQWSARPRIVTTVPSSSPTTAAPRKFTPVEPGVAGSLIAAGFSANAANLVGGAAGGVGNPVDALSAALEAARVEYPVENRTAIITIQGAPGSGRTTALMRMALDCADSGREAILVAADSSHAGGRAQVHAYGEAIGLAVFDAFSPKDLVSSVSRAPKGACVFIDVPAGRWNPPPLPGIAHFVYLAVPAHWQPAAIEAELSEFDSSSCSGAILTGTDLATSLTPALSLLVESQLGVAFLSSGRDVATGIGIADPITLASGVFTTPTRETTNGRLAVTA